MRPAPAVASTTATDSHADVMKPPYGVVFFGLGLFTVVLFREREKDKTPTCIRR